MDLPTIIKFGDKLEKKLVKRFATAGGECEREMGAGTCDDTFTGSYTLTRKPCSLR